MQYVFNITGIVFLWWAIAYFAYQPLFGLADSVKSVTLFLLAIVFFFLADMRFGREMAR